MGPPRWCSSRRAVPSLAWGQHALATQRALAKLLRVFEPTRRLLGRAFNTLCDTADGMARMHRQRRRALNAWRDGCASRERCLGLMHQGVAALVFHERARAMNTWVEATESARAAAAAERGVRRVAQRRLPQRVVHVDREPRAALSRLWCALEPAPPKRAPRIQPAEVPQSHQKVSLTDHGTEVLKQKR